MKKLLIVYYSWANGNTERVAKMLQSITGADLAEIDTLIPYTGGYDAVVAQGQQEVESGYKPEIKPLSIDVENYDAIAVGTPTWWYTMAPAVRTFLHGQNWAGRRMIPFATHGGWPGHVIPDMEEGCPGADISCQMEVRFDSDGGDRMETPEADILAWARRVRAMMEE